MTKSGNNRTDIIIFYNINFYNIYLLLLFNLKKSIVSIFFTIIDHVFISMFIHAFFIFVLYIMCHVSATLLCNERTFLSYNSCDVEMNNKGILFIYSLTYVDSGFPRNVFDRSKCTCCCEPCISRRSCTAYCGKAGFLQEHTSHTFKLLQTSVRLGHMDCRT